MTRKETIRQLRLQIEAKQQEIDELTARLGAEIVDGRVLRTHAITKSGEPARIATIIRYENEIKPL